MAGHRRNHFNPRSHERSDDKNHSGAVDNAEFQSTLPREERRRPHIKYNFNQKISIHAPTRGATVSWVSGRISKLFQSTLPREERRNWKHVVSEDCKFQSTLPREERLTQSLNHYQCKEFQSTLPREERLIIKTLCKLSSYFNPRSHERSDSNIAQKICLFLYNTDNKYIIR